MSPLPRCPPTQKKIGRRRQSRRSNLSVHLGCTITLQILYVPQVQVHPKRHSRPSVEMHCLQELQYQMKKNADPLNVEQVANDVVHPITQETITNHSKLISDPVAREIWLEALAKELGRLA